MLSDRHEIDAQAVAERLLSSLQCGQPRCRCAVAARRGHGLTHCPVHLDNTPSFNVTLKANRLLVCCEAGCAQDVVVGKLKEQGDWPEQASYGKQIIAEYDYCDADGKLLYQAVRYFPKDFRQRQPNGAGKWTWKVEGVSPVPYRLRELLESAPRRVFVLEGEKDCDRLAAWDFVATCNVGGAGKWRQEYAQYFKGRHVWLIPDNDDAGRQHMIQVARNLRDVAASLHWIELPGIEPKEDLSDWIDDGGTQAQFKELVIAATVPPIDQKRERVFRKEGFSYRYEPAEVPMVARFARITDHRDETTAEMHVTRADGGHVTRRRINLLAASGSTFTGIIEDLKDAELAIEADWKRILREAFEQVLEAHRNGLVVETIGGSDMQLPPPVEWFCDGLLMADTVNCWLGAGGTGKSSLAQALATCYAAGIPFMGRSMGEPGCVAYCDWEDGKRQLERITWGIAKSAGVPVPKILYLPMRGRKFKDSVESVGNNIVDHKIKLLIIDAIAGSGSAPGEHVPYEAVALELEQAIGQLPPVTVLGLDHVTAEDHRQGNASVPLKARGSERKVEFFRNQWTLMLDRSEMSRGRHIVSWHHTKINAAKQRPQFACEIIHDERNFVVDVRQAGLEISPEAISILPLLDQYVCGVKREPGLTLPELVALVRDKDVAQFIGDERKMKNLADNGRSKLVEARRRGLVYEQDGKWYPADTPRNQTSFTDPEPLPFDSGQTSDEDWRDYEQGNELPTD